MIHKKIIIVYIFFVAYDAMRIVRVKSSTGPDAMPRILFTDEIGAGRKSRITCAMSGQ
jgi:hypothetical protein